MLNDVFELNVLIEHKKEPVVCYANVWNSKKYFHIRKLWDDGGTWKPGKGLSMAYEQKEALLDSLTAMAPPGASQA